MTLKNNKDYLNVALFALGLFAVAYGYWFIGLFLMFPFCMQIALRGRIK